MTNETLIVRPFEATDTAELSKIWLDASRIAHPFIGERRLLEQRLLIEEQGRVPGRGVTEVVKPLASAPLRAP